MNFFCFPVCMMCAGSFCPYCLYCRFWERLSHQPVLHMPKNGHLTWKAIYQPDKVVAVGYKNGKRVLVETEETSIQLTCNADHLKDGTISVISYMIREFLYLLFIIIALMYIISVYINL